MIHTFLCLHGYENEEVHYAKLRDLPNKLLLSVKPNSTYDHHHPPANIYTHKRQTTIC